MHTTTRRRLAAVGIVAALTTPVAATVASTSAAAATSAAPFCGITWGSLPKATSPGQLWTRQRHRGTDRPARLLRPARLRRRPGQRHGSATTSATSTSVTGPGSGLPVPVSGGAKIQITINAPSTLGTSTTTFSGWRTFRQLKNVGSFEGYTDYGLGVRARLPMRVFVLTDTDGGRRLVVDVAHRW